MNPGCPARSIWLSRVISAALVAVVIGAAGELTAGVPGSATTPPKTIRSPNPPAPLDGRGAGVVVLVWIDAAGAVEQAEFVRGTEEWFPVVAAAIREWRFEPVLADGQPIPARVEVSVAFSGRTISLSLSPLPNLPGELHVEGELGLVAPSLAYDPDVILPLEGRISRATPKALIRYVVEEDGSTGRFEVGAAPSEQATRAALDLVSVQHYRPATIRGRPVAVEYTQAVSFFGGAEMIPALDGVTTVQDPAYPYDRLLANEAGRAKVRFRLGGTGEVVEAVVLETTHPDFGAALVAAVETWTFTPEAATAAPEREFEYEFLRERVPYGARRLAAFLRDGGEISNRASGLDARPQLLARPGLVYPRGLQGSRTAGTAKIEFVIDRSGLAQLPRILEASAPEFGWAAVTCVNGMRFAPICREGKPAELRVVLPLQFSPPSAEGTL